METFVPRDNLVIIAESCDAALLTFNEETPTVPLFDPLRAEVAFVSDPPLSAVTYSEETHPVVP